MYMWVKKLNLVIFTHSSQAKLSPRFSLSPQPDKNYASSLGRVFQISLPLEESEGLCKPIRETTNANDFTVHVWSNHSCVKKI